MVVKDYVETPVTEQCDMLFCGGFAGILTAH